MLLAEIKTHPRLESFDVQSVDSVVEVDADFDFVSWKIFSCWKQQPAHRFGAGTSAPSIPRSQRQYDGDNHFDYCETL